MCFYLGLFPWSTVGSLLATNIGYVLPYESDTVAGNQTLLTSYGLVLCTGETWICHETCPASCFAPLGFHQVRSVLSLISLSPVTFTILLECSAVGYWWGILSWCNSKSESNVSQKLRDALLKMVAWADTCDYAVLLQPIKPNWDSLWYAFKSI